MAAQNVFYYTRVNEPIPDHLEPLLSQNIEEVQQRINWHENRIASFDQQICDIDAQIEALRYKRSVLYRARLSVQKYSLQRCRAPIRQIPPEIVAQVIYFATRGENGTTGGKERHIFMALRSVCKLWRDMSFSTPVLWRDLLIDNWSLGRTPDMISRRLTSWISHCKGVDWMDITINTRDAPCVHEILSTLSAAKVNIGALYLDRCREYKPVQALSNLSQPMPTLKWLSLSLSRTPPHLALTTPFPNQLERVLLAADRRHAGLHFTLGHQYLRCLELQKLQLPLSSIICTLKHLPALQQFWAIWLKVLPPPNGEEQTSIEPFVHSSLQQVSLAGPVPTPLLSSLICPKIRTLRIGATEESDIPPETEEHTASIVAEFVRRSNPHTICITLRRGITSKFIQTLFPGVATISSHLEVLVSRYDLLVSEGGVPVPFPSNLQSLYIGQHLCDYEFMEWLMTLGLDGSDCPVEVTREDQGKFWSNFM
ncbi:hypothetical protein BKA70DRAFT_1279077 [Coprinopsis sp. MPI-PUGE-AT-0042]|nr:hypothetical protein BKA70DRAFT_1279077 [Coprinopsis sp. MPI-PUGE-AT-0042]